MRAQLKGLHSPDIPDLERWSPDEVDFGFLLQAMIGPVEHEGGESFDMLVCTPGWFAQQMREQNIRSGEHTLFMNRYDYRSLVAYIENRVQACEAPSWPQLAERLNYLGHWEFDGYQERIDK